MKLHHLIFCSLALLLAACSRDEPPVPGTCTTVTLPPQLEKCPNDSANPRVTLHTQTMTVTPPWACADKDATIEVQITPPPGEAGTVVIAPKEPEHDWLTGTNSPDPGRISIPVPNDTDEGDYEYGVDIPGTGKCIDPRIRVL